MSVANALTVISLNVLRGQNISLNTDYHCKWEQWREHRCIPRDL